MTIIIEIYIIVCISLLVFNIGFLAVKNAKAKDLKDEDMAFKDILRQEVAFHRETGNFSDEFRQSLPKKLSDVKHLASLMDIFEEQPDVKPWFRRYLFEQIGNYQKKPEYVQAFYTYVISVLDFSEEPVPSAFSSEFLDFLESRSLYTFVNTMDALYDFGEVSLLLQGLEVVDKRKGFYHHKLLVDGLLGYRGDHKELVRALLERFDRYGDGVKQCLLDYFRMHGAEVSDLCMCLMREKRIDPEVQYRAMRYFQKFPCAEAREEFLQILKQEDALWIRQMLAIQGLQRYDDAEVRTAVKKKITSRDWHVRNNVVEFLYKKGMDKEELVELLQLKDRYANESLLYRFKEEEEMAAFITETIRRLQQENGAETA